PRCTPTSSTPATRPPFSPPTSSSSTTSLLRAQPRPVGKNHHRPTRRGCWRQFDTCASKACSSSDSDTTCVCCRTRSTPTSCTSRRRYALSPSPSPFLNSSALLARYGDPVFRCPLDLDRLATKLCSGAGVRQGD